MAGSDGKKREMGFHPARPALLLVSALLAGCAQTVPAFRPQPIETPRALIDSYLIAHGMALGYGRSGRAGPAEIAQLIRYDRAAMIAVATATLEPGADRTRNAKSAVSAMLRYTGDQDLSGVPAPDALTP